MTASKLKPKSRGAWIVPTIVGLVALLVCGSCAHTTLSCWHRGGSVVKNIFDWPVCIEPHR